MASNPSAVTLKDALRTYQKGLDTERSKTIDVDRTKLWKTAQVLYKSTPKEHLYRQLNVMFEGLEDAVDAGALRLEFFGDLLRSINNTLFEGKPDHRVPLYSWENIYLMKMAGIMVSHSILQNGPGMPSLAPYVYEFIIWGGQGTRSGICYFWRFTWNVTDGGTHGISEGCKWWNIYLCCG